MITGGRRRRHGPRVGVYTVELVAAALCVLLLILAIAWMLNA